MMQPGYAWIDKRYLHTYTQFLPREIVDRLRYKTLYEAGVCLCGSSDSPVQDLDPWLQMLGMTDFYNPEESVTPFEAFRCYTVHPARAILEGDERGTLEVGKAADFFTADKDLFALNPKDIVSFRPARTYYGGRPYRRKRGTVAELLWSMLKKARPV
jgi:predicted amidohydrolase YtcJ